MDPNHLKDYGFEVAKKPNPNLKNHQKTKPCMLVLKGLLFIGSALTFIRHFICNTIMVVAVFFIWLGMEFADEVKDLPQNMVEQSKTAMPLEKPQLLNMNLAGEISEMPFSDNEFDVFTRELNASLGENKLHSLDLIEKTLKTAALDPDIKALVLNLDQMGAISLEMAERIGKALDSFKNGQQDLHKKVYVFATTYTQSRYIIAAHADEIVLDPLGSLNFKGIGLNTLYYKALLDRFKITPYIFRAGEFKSAVEPFIRNDMSAGVKQEYQKIANGIWDEYLKLINKRPGALSIVNKLIANPQHYIDSIASHNGNQATLALNLKLCDKIASFEELQAQLAKDFGLKEKTLYTPKSIAYEDYLPFYDQKSTAKTEHDKFVCIYGLGEITDNSQYVSDFSPKNLVPILDKIALDDSVKGVLFYINSGGGSVSGSEKIARALKRLKVSGKKVVVSFNGTGASGAYWIAANADKIVATSTSLTGSIGVFGMSFGFDKLLNDYGITQDGVVTHETANYNIAKPMSATEMALNKLTIEGIYDKFLKLVTENRPHLKAQNYKEFAEGKVFMANDAKALGLIDAIGDKDQAYELLCEITALKLPLENLVPSQEKNLGFLQNIFFSKISIYLPHEITKALLNLSLKNQEKVDNSTIMAISPVEIKLD